MAKEPDAKKILETLLKLYADQMGVKAKITVKEVGDNVEANTG